MEVVLHLLERVGMSFAQFSPRVRRALAIAVCAAVSGAGAAAAQDDPKAEDAPAIEVELNKLEPQDKSCRAYVVVNNKSQDDYTAYKLDLVMFQPDGVIGRRFAVDLAPIRPGKRTVKLFDIDNLKCDEVGSFLINDVVECAAGGSSPDNCLARIAVSSRAKVEFTK
jgi:hypothetical protein